MPSLNSRSLPFVVFLGGFPSRCQNLSSGAIRPGGLLLISINIDSNSPSMFISMSSRRWYVRLSSTKIATPPLDFDCLMFAIRLYHVMSYNVMFWSFKNVSHET